MEPNNIDRQLSGFIFGLLHPQFGPSEELQETAAQLASAITAEFVVTLRDKKNSGD